MKNTAMEIPNHPSYFVTRNGKIFHQVNTWTYQGKTKRGKWWKELIPEKTRLGYLRIRLGRKRYLVHSIVANLLIEKTAGMNEVNHIDGDKCNNAADNLEWTTRSGNLLHAFAIGLCNPKRGVNSKSSKLTETDVIEIREELLSYKIGMIKEIARRYCVTPEAISAIRHRKNWAHI